MGRWTNNYHDQVLASKVENIVSGILKKNKEETDEKKRTHFSYQAFVKNLDEQDLFTRELIEILFKELADREQYGEATDKVQISTRTLESLRHLTYQSSVYQVPGSSNGILFSRNRLRRRRAEPLNTYSYDMVESQSEEDGDELGQAEGARLDPALHDAFSSAPGWPRPRYTTAYTPQSGLYHSSQMYDGHSLHRPRYSSMSNPLRVRGFVPRYSYPRNSASTGEDAPINPEFEDYTLRRRNSSRQLRENRDSEIRGVNNGDARETTPRPSSAVPVLPLPRPVSSVTSSLFAPPSPPQSNHTTENQAPILHRGELVFRELDAQTQGQVRPSAYRVLSFPPGASGSGSGSYTEESGRRPSVYPNQIAMAPITPQDDVIDNLLSAGSSSSSRSGLLRPEPWESSLEREFLAWFTPQELSQNQQRRSGQELPTSLPTPRSVSPNGGSETPEDAVSNANATVASTTAESTVSSSST